MTLRILCFGASITAGYHRHGLAYHPYAIRLKQRLQQYYLSRKIEIEIDAVPGDRVIGGRYANRLEKRCRDGVKKFDYMLIQGGGNDLLQGSSPEEVFEGLKNLWKIALDSGAHVLGLTITKIAGPSEAIQARYGTLNALIINHIVPGFLSVDVCRALPWPTDSTKQRQIWDDGLHFTPLGYNVIGDTIAETLLKLMKPLSDAKI